MRSYWFLALAALAVTARFGVDLSAGARRQARVQARHERKACRRGVSYFTPASPAVNNGYPDQVQPVGAHEALGWKWECDGQRCRLVPVATPDPVSKVEPVPPVEKTEYTVTEAAAALGCSRSSVNRQVRALALGRMIARIHILSPDDLERVRGLVNREPGNPEWIALRKEKPVPVKKPAARKKSKGKV